MRVVVKAGICGILERAQGAPDDVLAVDEKDVEAGPAEVGLENKGIVAPAYDDAVVIVSHGTRGFAD
jgi:hypothetical protein